MTCTVYLSNQAALSFDTIRAVSNMVTPGILLSIQGRKDDETLNCALIPFEMIDSVIAALKLAAMQVTLIPRDAA